MYALHTLVCYDWVEEDHLMFGECQACWTDAALTHLSGTSGWPYLEPLAMGTLHAFDWPYFPLPRISSRRLARAGDAAAGDAATGHGRRLEEGVTGEVRTSQVSS